MKPGEPKSIWSDSALEKLRSPEKLDTMVRVTDPMSWMGLAVACVLSFAVILWSIFGAFTEKADGMGLILDSAGVVNIYHVQSGKIKEILVRNGDVVHKGEIIARMEKSANLADVQMSIYGMELAENDRDAAQRAYEHDSKQQQVEIERNIYSSYDGIVDEVMVKEGSIVPAGNPICSVRITQDRNELKGVFYIAVDKGKRVKPNMTIRLAPNGVDTTQAGSLLGVVRKVSEYPITSEKVALGVGNAQLSQYILQKTGGVVMEIDFDLIRDASSDSGYLWTSVVGKHSPITPGSFCTGYIIIDRQPPIEKVFYKLSQLLRSR